MKRLGETYCQAVGTLTQVRAGLVFGGGMGQGTLPAKVTPLQRMFTADKLLMTVYCSTW